MSIEVVSEPPNARVDIVFVNGWSANGQTWTTGSEETAVSWPRSILSNLLPHARIILFKYEANVEGFWAVSSKNEIDDHAKYLLDDVTEHRIKTKTSDRLVILVAHSIGGIVCERTLVRAQTGYRYEQEFAKNVKRIAFLGTPFHTDKAKWAETGKNFFRLAGYDTPLNDDIAKSEELSDICEKFLLFLKTQKDIEVAIFFEGIDTDLGETAIVLADKEAVKIPDCPDPSRLKATHQGMAEVASEKDEHFKRGLFRQLSRWVNQAVDAKVDNAKRDHYNISFEGQNYGLQIGNNPGRVEGIDIRHAGKES